MWGVTFGVNVTGAYIVADVRTVFKPGAPASVALTTIATRWCQKGSLPRHEQGSATTSCAAGVEMRLWCASTRWPRSPS